VTEPMSVGPAVHTDATVTLALPADAAYVSVLRTVTASLAARRDFTLEEIDDLRIAVDEASALLLPQAGGESRLEAVFDGDHDRLTVRVSVNWPDRDHAQIDETSFAWMVLAALTDQVSTSVTAELVSVTLTKARGALGR
jgi:serine/threonine-protein kinase RsbW